MKSIIEEIVNAPDHSVRASRVAHHALFVMLMLLTYSFIWTFV